MTQSGPDRGRAAKDAKFEVASSDPMANEQGFGESRLAERTVARLRSVFEQSRNAMLLADDRRRWVNGNTAAAELLGIAREEIPWQSMDDFTSPSDLRALDEQWRVFLGGGAAEGWYQLWIETRGSAAPLEFSATANVLPSRHLAVFIPPEEPSTAPAQPVVAEWTLPPEPASAPELTRREREVMTLLATGLQGREIAERLLLSPETVKSHVRNALAKLGRRTRAGGVAIALITGQIDW
jgi:PAS domain S-box-containing protein